MTVAKDTTGPCQRPTSDNSSNTTLPIVLGVVIPLTVAFLAMIILHRRHVKKLKKEDAEDRHKSLDFGLVAGGQSKQNGKSKRGKKGRPEITRPEMTTAEAHNIVRKDRGLSMDMNMTSPYLLPPELEHSRESLHSLSRAYQTGDDKYGRTNFIPDDGSIRSPSSLRHGGDDSSTYTGSSRPTRFDTESSKELLRGAPSLSSKANVPTIVKETSPDSNMPRKPLPPSKDNLLAPNFPNQGRESIVSTASSNGVSALRKSNDYLGAFIRGGGHGLGLGTDDKDTTKTAYAQVTELPAAPIQVQHPAPALLKADDHLDRQRESVYSDEAELSNAQEGSQRARDRQPRLPQLNFLDSSQGKQQSFELESPVTDTSVAPAQAQNPPPRRESQQASPQYEDYSNHYSQQSQSRHDQYDHHQVPEIHTEQYDEEDYYDPADEYDYYGEYEEDGHDPRRLTMGMRPLPPDDPSENPEQRANRIRSFYKEYFDAPSGGQGQQYYDGSEYYDDYYGNDVYQAPRGYSVQGRHRATVSNGAYGGPRAFSSASGRYGRFGGGPRPRMPPKKKAPPPKALNVLPTPSKLKDDTFILDMAVDFAPPSRAVFQRSGTPDSLRGGQRPYSPTIRAHIPLTSSFDDLAAMPSPQVPPSIFFSCSC